MNYDKVKVPRINEYNIESGTAETFSQKYASHYFPDCMNNFLNISKIDHYLSNREESYLFRLKRCLDYHESKKKTLNLKGNKIEHIDESIFSVMVNLKILDLDTNIGCVIKRYDILISNSLRIYLNQFKSCFKEQNSITLSTERVNIFTTNTIIEIVKMNFRNIINIICLYNKTIFLSTLQFVVHINMSVLCLNKKRNIFEIKFVLLHQREIIAIRKFQFQFRNCYIYKELFSYSF